MSKKIFSILSIAMVVVAMSSCGSTKDLVSLSSLNGEWNIIEVKGAVVVPGDNQPFPFIGFNTQSGQIHGNSGCNRMTGSFDNTGKPGYVNLGPIASTRMMCIDMSTEQSILIALAEVKRYKEVGSQMALCNERNRPVMILERKAGSNRVTVFTGEWLFTTVNGEEIPFNLDQQPFLSFDASEKRIHGNAGCNGINGEYIVDENAAQSLSFGRIVSTMKACPNLELEGKIMRALNAVKSYRVNAEELALYNETGSVVLTLLKKR